jgi:hypothetical protein
MVRLLGIALIAFAGLALVACAGATAPKVDQGKSVQPYAGGPRLALEQRSVDYGKVQFDQPVKATFTARNVGDRPLTVQKVDVKTVQGC